MAGEKVAVEGGERKRRGRVLDDVVRLRHRKQLKIVPLQLDHRVAGTERVLAARAKGKAQGAIGLAQRVQIAVPRERDG